MNNEKELVIKIIKEAKYRYGDDYTAIAEFLNNKAREFFYRANGLFDQVSKTFNLKVAKALAQARDVAMY